MGKLKDGLLEVLYSWSKLMAGPVSGVDVCLYARNTVFYVLTSLADMDLLAPLSIQVLSQKTVLGVDPTCLHVRIRVVICKSKSKASSNGKEIIKHYQCFNI